jgi:endonuclease/exonuclease/phosphatase (EEP) superfamily protein YafD
MSPIRILAAAAAMVSAPAVAVLALAGFGGWRNGWLDVINIFAPVILAVALLAAGLGYWSLDGAPRAVTLGIAMIGVIYGLTLTGPEVLLSWRPRTQGVQPFRVLSANLWRDNPTLALAVDSLIARNADTIFLQEAGGLPQADLTRLRSLYPYVSESPGFGVQIFSKAPIEASGRGSTSGPLLNLVWIQTVAGDGRPVTLVNTHFDWPFPPAPQKAQRAFLAERIRQLPTDNMILGGDFNTTPWSFAMKNQDGLLAPLKRQTRAWASWPARVDALRRSWPAPFLPIDHVYTGPGWRLGRMTRLRIPGSDHFAIEAVLTRR